MERSKKSRYKKEKEKKDLEKEMKVELNLCEILHWMYN